LLRDDITIGESFAREVELWSLMLRCWRLNPEHRPQIWEVKDFVKNLLTFPLGQNKSTCYTNIFVEKDPEEHRHLSNWKSTGGYEEPIIVSCCDISLGDTESKFLSPKSGKTV
jgi:hypothetical protein